MDLSGNKRSGQLPELLPFHGGYRDLKSYQMAEIVHNATVVFCDPSTGSLRWVALSGARRSRRETKWVPRALPRGTHRFIDRRSRTHDQMVQAARA
jgi:hypothetical protein